MKYTCTDCEWSSNGDDDPKPTAKRAIEHHIEFGHHVKRVGESGPIQPRGSRFR